MASHLCTRDTQEAHMGVSIGTGDHWTIPADVIRAEKQLREVPLAGQNQLKEEEQGFQ